MEIIKLQHLPDGRYITEAERLMIPKISQEGFSTSLYRSHRWAGTSVLGPYRLNIIREGWP